LGMKTKKVRREVAFKRAHRAPGATPMRSSCALILAGLTFLLQDVVKHEL
jgi:hypothetical protein